jgi:hypothetical protein
VEIILQSIKDTFDYAPRLGVVFFALFATEVLFQCGGLQKLEFIGRPIVKLARLPSESVIAFITAIGSPLAANTMVAQLCQENVLSTKESYLSALVNGIPTYIKETFTYQLAVIMPALGPKIGGVYLATFLLGCVCRIVFVIVTGRIILTKKNSIRKQHQHPERRTINTKTIIWTALRKQTRTFVRICIIFLVVTFSLACLINSGVVYSTKKYLAPITNILNLPEESIIPVSTFALSPLVGASGIGALLNSGRVTERQGIIMVLLGGLLLLPIYGIRYSLAYYASIFGFRLGVGILVTSIGIGMVVRAFVLLLFII